MNETLLVTDRAMLRHDPGAGHPERPERIIGIIEKMERDRPAGILLRSPRLAVESELTRVHLPTYTKHILGLRGAARVSVDPDTHIGPGSIEAALMAAGAAIEAADAVIRGSFRSAFALVRPPGHHAEPGRAMGFCLFNNVAIAVAHARAVLGIQRVLVIDWDIHCGNGTQAAFAEDPDVVVFDVHRHPFYPFSGGFDDVGRGRGKGRLWNVPMPSGLGDGDYFRIFEEVLFPAADAFNPEFVIVSAGFDAHRDDPLGDQMVSDEGFAALAGIAKAIADRYASGRLAMVLEGGYDIAAVERSVLACLAVMGGSTAPTPRQLSHAGDTTLRQAAAVARRHWRPD